MAIRATITVVRASAEPTYVALSASTTNVNLEAIATLNYDYKNQYFYDTSTLSEVQFVLVEKNLSETLTIDETVGLDYSKPKVETLALVETFVKAVTFNRSFTDAFTLDDLSQIDKDYFGAKGNVAFMTDIIGLDQEKVLSDSYTVADVVTIAVNYIRPYADSYTLADESSFMFVKNVEDAITLDDTSLINKDFDNQSQNTFGFTDLLGNDFGKVLVENISHLDEVSILQGLNKSDSTTLSDTYERELNKAISDAFTLDDSALIDKDYFGDKGNVLGFSDVLSYDASKELTDGIALVELVGFVLNHPVEDSFTISDESILHAALGRTETIGISESYIRSIIKNLTDGLALDDTTLVNKDIDSTKGNIITFGDVVDIALQKVREIADSYTFTDESNRQIDKGIAESLVFSELVDIATNYNKAISDTFVLDDSALVDKDYFGNKGNVVGLSEVVSQSLGKEITDSTSVSDVYDVLMTKILVESLTLTETIESALNKTLTDTLTLTDGASIDFVSGEISYAINTFTLNNFLLNGGIGEAENLLDSSTLIDVYGLQLVKTLSDGFTLDDSALIDKDYFGDKGNIVGVSDQVTVDYYYGGLLGQRPLNTMSFN